MTRDKISDYGYVALEFAMAMGMIVLPTALILLQIPTFLEQHDRASAIATSVANACANNVSKISESQSIADSIAEYEMAASSSLHNSSLNYAKCDFESQSIAPGSRITSEISIEVPAALIPGLKNEVSWTMNSRHTAIVPKYRSFDE